MSKTRYWDIFIHTNMFVIWTHISLDSPVTIIRRKFAQSILKVIHSSVEGQPSWKSILKKKNRKNRKNHKFLYKIHSSTHHYGKRRGKIGLR